MIDITWEDAAMRNILFFGDSNTYGYKPDKTGRYDFDVRWTGRISKILGSEYNIIEEGLCGRTTIFPDAVRDARKGIDLIGVVVESHKPVDVISIMLGTNDCKTEFNADANTIAKRMEAVAGKAKETAGEYAKIVIVSPIHLGKGVGEEGFDPEFDKRSENVSRQLAGEYKKVAKENGFYYFDAAGVAKPSEVDRQHLDEEGHKIFAEKYSEFLLTEVL
jgi:lysophospholipase L1-like esterase